MALGIPPNSFQAERLAAIENESKKRILQKLRNPTAKGILKRKRLLQAKKYKGLGEYGHKPHAGRAPRKCGHCKKVGHDRRNCPALKNLTENTN
jgi:hypothetical protein